MKMKKELGQFFTTHETLLETIWRFTKNTHGAVLEPSCGAGHIVDYIVKSGETRPITCVEIDQDVERLACLDQPGVFHESADFLKFDFGDAKFTTIVGNPPYVKRKGKCNMYVEFIRKCADLLTDDGELIFVIPSDFFKLTSASALKTMLYDNGCMTHIFHPNDEGLFKDAAQDVIVFRYQKGVKSYLVEYNGESKKQMLRNGNVYFEGGGVGQTVRLADVFDVKVGMVSGADKVFRHEGLGNKVFKTFTGDRKYICIDELPEDGAELTEYLKGHKDALISRRIKKFNETNWFRWGCPRNVEFMEKEKLRECLYCATITRKNPVFFKGVVGLFDGSLLCLLPKDNVNTDLDSVLEHLNSPSFLDNFRFAGRIKIGQKSLAECHLPSCAPARASSS
jgi:adenine-specific DNA-methyltransferase